MGKIIELKKVNKWFDKFQVLKDIDLEVAAQEKIVICGPSGSGKSTFINILCGLLDVNKGQIYFDENLKGYDQTRLYAYLSERYLSFWFKKYSK